MIWNAVHTLQGWVYLVIGLGVLGVEVYALIDAIRQRTDAFPRAGKLTEPIWSGILGFASLIGLVAVTNLPGLLTFDIIGLVAAGVYLADVRPAVRGSSGGSNSGPYGPW